VSLHRTHLWVCDVCEKEETTMGEVPHEWVVDISVVCHTRKLSADVCGECYIRAFPTPNDHRYHPNVPKEEFRKPFWKKFWSVT
jgi:hypothetical protein